MTNWFIPFFVVGADAVSDVRKREIFPLLTAVSAAAGTAAALLETKNITADLFTAMLPGAMLLLVSLISDGQVGRGDALSVFCIGTWVGMWETWAILMIGIFAAAVFSVFLWAVRQKNSEIPFVPFLLAAMIAVRLYQTG